MELVCCVDALDELFDKSILPDITIINGLIKLEELHSGLCKVVDLRGVGKVGVQSKVNMITALSDRSGDKYIIIADSGWALK